MKPEEALRLVKAGTRILNKAGFNLCGMPKKHRRKRKAAKRRKA